MTTLLQESIDNVDLQKALELTEDSTFDVATMLTEALEEAFEQPDESEEHNALQFFSQDNVGISDQDLQTSFHPDNTDSLNAQGRGAAVSGVSAANSVESLFSEFVESSQLLSDADAQGGDDNPLILDQSGDLTAQDLLGLDDDSDDL